MEARLARFTTTTVREGERFPGVAPAWRAVTVGPFSDDWAVVDDQGLVAYLGPAVMAARYAAWALR